MVRSPAITTNVRSPPVETRTKVLTSKYFSVAKLSGKGFLAWANVVSLCVVKKELRVPDATAWRKASVSGPLLAGKKGVE